MRRKALLWTLLILVGSVFCGVGPGVDRAEALPAGLDGDGDGYTDAIETGLGSDAGDEASTPENVALAGSCFDGEDNDGDGTTDIDDTGCITVEPADQTFPEAGDDVFDSSMTLDGYELAIFGGASCVFDLEADGPVVVRRGTPSNDALPVVDVEIIAMQLTGSATILPGGTNCPLSAGSFDVTIIESPSQDSTGQVTDTNTDPTLDFPADSFFDVFFDVIVTAGGTDTLLTGGPSGGPVGDPVRLENTINTLPPYHGGKNTLCYEVPNQEHEHCPKAPPDHYTCYNGKFSPKFKKQTVTLQDQFDAQGSLGIESRVLKPLFFCTPTAKDGEPLYEETGHIQCYQLKPKKAKRTVVVRNQFGQGNVKTKKATVLCLPTEKNDEGTPQELDHFKCYSGKFPKLPKRDVTLVDQFGIIETKVLKPTMLCNPTRKNGEPIVNPTTHLECFKIKPKKVKETVTAVNQFGTWTVKTKKASVLCVPSGKAELTTTTTTTTTPETTTTTLPGIELVVDYNHPTPGMPPSLVCGRVTAPSMPGATADVTVSGPGILTGGQVMVVLDGSGVGQFQVEIFNFGQYSVNVDVGGLMAAGTVDVQSAQSSCP